MNRSLTIFLVTCSLGLSAQTYEGTAAARRFPGAEVLRYDTHSGQLNYVRLRRDAQQPLSELIASALYRHHWSPHDWVPFQTYEDQLGMRHTRLQAHHAGHPIEAAVAVVHEAQGRVTAINGELPASTGFSGQALLTEQAAKAIAAAHVGARQYMWQIPGVDKLLRAHTGDPHATYTPPGELVYVPVQGDFKRGQYRLAWKLDIYALAPLSRDNVFVDAERGEVIWQYPRMHTADVTGTAVTAYTGTRTLVTDQIGPTNYRLRESGRGGGILTYNCEQTINRVNPVDFADTDNHWDNVNAQLDQYAPDCHVGVEVAYDYFKNTYNWNSVDNLGLPLVSYVHYGIDLDNAFWDGNAMGFGDGSSTFNSPLTTPDIVAHEMTHGVTQFSAGLIYAGESGAMNEAFSDIFGKVVETILRPTSWDWGVGRLCTPGNTGVRDMASPNTFQNPDTYGGLYWIEGGGVHSNSGVGNKWFQVLVDGESGINDLGNAYQVTGIGLAKAAAIAFRTLTVYLTPTSNYADTRFFATESARDLYGACSMEQVQTANAWYAVGVGNLTTSQPVVNFTAIHPISCTAPATFHFQNNSSIVQSYFWDFGDGGTSTLPNPSHTYATYGNYTVKLVVTGCTGIQDSMLRVQYIRVDSALPCTITSMPSFGTDTLSACIGGLRDPGGSSNYPNYTRASTLIDVPNTQLLTLNFALFEMEDIGDYLTIHDGSDHSAPVIGTFIGSALPGGGTITASSGKAFLEFSSDLSNNGPGFEMYWECTPVTAPPIAAFQATPLISCDGSVQFIDVATHGVTSWAWDFGDGHTSSQAKPTHQYAADGTYTVSLVVCNMIGCDTLVRNNCVTVNHSPVCMASMPSGGTSSTTACKGILFDPGGYSNYDDLEFSTYTIQPPGATCIVIDFNEFLLENGRDFLRIYDGPTLIGRYTGQSLPNGGTVKTNSGVATLVFSSDPFATLPGFEIRWHAINALNGASASFTAPMSAPVATTVNFTDQSIGATAYAWDFGDGTVSTFASPSHSYAANGAYHVVLRVVSAIGCLGEYSQVISIGMDGSVQPPDDRFRVWPSPGNGLFEVEDSSLRTEAPRIVVHNALGQQVHAEVYAPGTTLRRSLDLRHFANGMYFVRMETSAGSSVRKVVIDHPAR